MGELAEPMARVKADADAERDGAPAHSPKVSPKKSEPDLAPKERRANHEDAIIDNEVQLAKSKKAKKEHVEGVDLAARDAQVEKAQSTFDKKLKKYHAMEAKDRDPHTNNLVSRMTAALEEQVPGSSC